MPQKFLPIANLSDEVLELLHDAALAVEYDLEARTAGEDDPDLEAVQEHLAAQEFLERIAQERRIRRVALIDDDIPF